MPNTAQTIRPGTHLSLLNKSHTGRHTAKQDAKLAVHMDMPNQTLLGIESDSFDRLYKKLNSIPRSVRRFVLQFKNDNTEIKAVRLFEQELARYDNNGSLKDSVLYFYPVDDFNETDLKSAYINPKDEKIIVIDNNSVLEKVWWYDLVSKKKHLVEW